MKNACTTCGCNLLDVLNIGAGGTVRSSIHYDLCFLCYEASPEHAAHAAKNEARRVANAERNRTEYVRQCKNWGIRPADRTPSRMFWPGPVKFDFS